MKRILAILLVGLCCAQARATGVKYFSDTDTLGHFRTNYNSTVSNLYALIVASNTNDTATLPVVGVSLQIAATNNVGSELVTDGGFAASPSAWVFVAAYTNNGRALVDAGNVGTIRKNSETDSPPIIAHASYQVSYSNCLDGAGAVRLEIGGVTNYQAFSGSRHYTFLATPENDSQTFTLTVYATNQMAIDNVSVKLVGGGDSVFAGSIKAGDNVKAGGSIMANGHLVVGDNVLAEPIAELSVCKVSNGIVRMQVFNPDATNSGVSMIQIGHAGDSGGYGAFIANNGGFIPAGVAGGYWDYYLQPHMTWLEGKSGGDLTIAHYGEFGTLTPGGHSGTVRIITGGTDLRYHTRIAVSNDGSVHFGTNKFVVNGPEFHHGPVVVSNTIRSSSTISGGNLLGGSVSASGDSSGYTLFANEMFGDALTAWVGRDRSGNTNDIGFWAQMHEDLENSVLIAGRDSRSNTLAYYYANRLMVYSNGTLYVNGTNVLGQSGSGATGSITAITLGGSNYTAGVPSLQIVGGGVSTGYDGSAATFTFPIAATGTPLYAYAETDTQAIARVNIASNGLQSQITTAQATGVAAHARADVAYTAAAAPNGAAVTNVPTAWTADTGAPTNAFSPTWISQDAGGTVTLYRTGGNYFSCSRTNPITVTFVTNDWATTAMSLRLDMLAGTGSVTWIDATVLATGTASHTNLGTLSTTATVPLMFDKASGDLFPCRIYNLAK